MDFKVTGLFKGKTPIEKVTDTFEKRMIQIETNAEYNNKLVFEVGGKKLDIADGYNAGDYVTVHFNIKCAPSKKGTWFTNLQAWKINPVQEAPAPGAGSFPTEADEPFNSFQ